MESDSFVVSGEVLASVYGPVQSRRHGLSLGVNVGLTQHKVCTWCCLYCQCGFGERRDYSSTELRIQVKELLLEIKNYLFKNPDVDSITLAGNTEPGTYPEILELVKGLQWLKIASRAKWKIVILSNGSELDRDIVVQAFNLADEAWIKLDTGTDQLFQSVSRPISRVGGLSAHIDRIKKLRKIRIQTLLWSNETKPELANDQEANLAALLQVYSELKPLQIHLTTVSRNPAMKGIVPVNESLLNTFSGRIHSLNLNGSVVV